jgi:hypothetical protein
MAAWSQSARDFRKKSAGSSLYLRRICRISPNGGNFPGGARAAFGRALSGQSLTRLNRRLLFFSPGLWPSAAAGCRSGAGTYRKQRNGSLGVLPRSRHALPRIVQSASRRSQPALPMVADSISSVNAPRQVDHGLFPDHPAVRYPRGSGPRPAPRSRWPAPFRGAWRRKAGCCRISVVPTIRGASGFSLRSPVRMPTRCRRRSSRRILTILALVSAFRGDAYQAWPPLSRIRSMAFSCDPGFAGAGGGGDQAVRCCPSASRASSIGKGSAHERRRPRRADPGEYFLQGRVCPGPQRRPGRPAFFSKVSSVLRCPGRFRVGAPGSSSD